MKQKYFFFFSSVIVFLFFMTLSGAFFASDSVLADVSTVCCDSGDGLGDYCVYSAGVPGVCRTVEGVIEDAACGAISGLNRLICDDHIHTGTYNCHCTGPDGLGQYDCNVVTNDCNDGYTPSCDCSLNVYQIVCNSDMSCCTPTTSYACSLNCEAGGLSGLGDPCECSNQCESGLVCHTWTYPSTCGVVPSDDIICCDGPTDTSCPDRIGYENLGCVEIPDGFPTTCDPRYQCSYGFVPSPTNPPFPTYPPIATPPPLPPTDWNSLYQAVQTAPGLFTFSNTLTMGGVISPMLRIIFPIAGLILLLMIIYGGYNWMLSAGDPKKAARAKEIITVALIGFIIIFTSYWLVQIIGSILGLGTIGIIF